MNNLKRILILLLLTYVPFARCVVNGDTTSVMATGSWEESHEGVSLTCTYLTNPVAVTKGSSSGGCFLTEAQASAKDSVDVSLNIYDVKTWDTHGLTAITSIYINKTSREETKPSDPNAIKYTWRLVVDFDSHSLTKYAEAAGKTQGYHLKK